MTLTKVDIINNILDKIVEDKELGINSCVVTNERGLIVAYSRKEGPSIQAMAAMISLLSDTASKINENMGFGHAKISKVDSYGTSVMVHEFQVLDKWFRIGVILTESSSFSKWSRLISRKSPEKKMIQAAKKITRILEGK